MPPPYPAELSVRVLSATVTVPLYRTIYVTTTANDGAYTDSTGTRGRATFTYKVCDAGTANCSNIVTLRFGGGH